MVETMYLSRLKIIPPQMRPKQIAIGIDLKTVNNAYPPERDARAAVEKIVAPIPIYLLSSILHSGLFRISRPAPEQIKKNFLSGLILSGCSSIILRSLTQVQRIWRCTLKILRLRGFTTRALRS